MHCEEMGGGKINEKIFVVARRAAKREEQKEVKEKIENKSTTELPYTNHVRPKCSEK